MTKKDLTDGTSTTLLTAFTTWLKHRWTAYISANENQFKVVRTETIESGDAPSFMRWAVVTRR